MSETRSLAQLADVFGRSRDTEGRRDVVCGYCKRRLERVSWSTARKWFVDHDCIGAAQPPRLTAAQLDLLLRFHALAGLLTERPSGGSWREMQATTRHYGGHRHGLVPPTAEQIAYAARVDKILARILGGIPAAPTGRRDSRSERATTTANVQTLPLNTNTEPLELLELAA